LLRNYLVPAFTVQVGCHELLGHGSGKLFQESNSTLNFDQNIINPITNQKVATWYKAGETYDSVFSSMGSAYEECRAEAVGIFLSTFPQVLEIFGYSEHKQQSDIMHSNWLQMVRAGVVGLEFYSPENTTWRQAHMRARYAILQVLLRAGQGFVTLNIGADNAWVSIDFSKIATVGVPAISDFLLKLQVYKSTADIAGAQKMFDDLTAVPAEFVALRQLVLKLRKPRKIFVQANTLIDGGEEVQLFEYENTHSGLVTSVVQRYQLLRQLYRL